MARVEVVGALTGSVEEDAHLEASGQALVSTPGASGSFIAGTFPGRFGSLTIEANGQWRYLLANGTRETQSLQGAAQAEEVFVATWIGAEAIQGFIHIAILGANDGAIFSGENWRVLDVVETTAVSGTMLLEDIDTGEKQFQPQAAVTGSHGVFSIGKSGEWQYELLPGHRTAIIDEQKAAVETFSVAALDGTVGSVTIYVTTDEARAPLLTSSNPAHGEDGVTPVTDLVLVFDEPIRRGSGEILLKTGSGSLVESFDAATSTRLAVAGTTLTLNPSADLLPGTGYQLEFTAGAVVDLAGNSFNASQTYAFRTAFPSVARIGTAGPDTLQGGTGADTLSGLEGNDALTGFAGNDALDGGPGIDVAVFQGTRADYIISESAGAYEVQSSTEGTDTLQGIERLHFSGSKLALDLSGNAGVVAKVLGAVFGAPRLSDPGFVGLALSYVDAGLSYEQSVGLALEVRLGPAATNTDSVVDLLYTNIAGTSPDTATKGYFVNMVNPGGLTLLELAMFAVDTTFNETNIGLTGLTASGLEYV